jgi:ketosteroid isomerase-like protein
VSSEETSVDLITRGNEAINRGDVDGVMNLCDPAMFCVLPEGGINAGTLEGLEGFRDFLSHYLDAFESLRFDPERLIEDDGRVVAFVRMSGKGRGSGLEVNSSPGHVWTVEAGKLTRLEVFPDGGQGALDALGLTGLE